MSLYSPLCQTHRHRYHLGYKSIFSHPQPWRVLGDIGGGGGFVCRRVSVSCRSFNVQSTVSSTYFQRRVEGVYSILFIVKKFLRQFFAPPVFGDVIAGVKNGFGEGDPPVVCSAFACLTPIYYSKIQPIPQNQYLSSI